MADLPRSYLWFVDRWRTSSAYADLDAPSQACYRNLLDELWLRGGKIPDNDRALSLASGHPDVWPKVRKAVLARMERKDGHWTHHKTLELIAEAESRAERRSGASRKAAQSRWDAERMRDALRTQSDCDASSASASASASGSASDSAPAVEGKAQVVTERGAVARRPRARTPLSQTDYKPGFLRCWTAFPHCGTRSRKPLAAEVWRRQQIEPQAEQVLAWIEWASGTEDFLRDGGKFVPGFQVWLRDRDFTDPPPNGRIADPRSLTGEKFRLGGDAMAAWLDSKRLEDQRRKS